MLLTIALYGLFHAISNATDGNQKLATNYVSFLNCNVALVLALLSWSSILSYGYLQWWLTSYYLYDTYVLLRSPHRFRTIDYAYLVHHAISVVSVQQVKHAALLSRLFFTVELSNWPMYIVKHHLEWKSPTSTIAFWKKIQFAIYVPLRIFGVGAFLIVPGAFFLKLIGFPVYLMGCVWSWKLWKQLSRENNNFLLCGKKKKW